MPSPGNHDMSAVLVHASAPVFVTRIGAACGADRKRGDILLFAAPQKIPVYRPDGERFRKSIFFQ
jgi:hypothetical protein